MVSTCSVLSLITALFVVCDFFDQSQDTHCAVNNNNTTKQVNDRQMTAQSIIKGQMSCYSF